MYLKSKDDSFRDFGFAINRVCTLAKAKGLINVQVCLQVRKEKIK